MRWQGEYKLRCVAGRASHFAHVTLLVYTTEDSLRTDSTEGVRAPSLWLDAAHEGARMALRETKMVSVNSFGVHMIKCEGTPADTDVDTLWCAGFLAAVSAVAPGKDAEPSYSHEDRRWHVLFEGRDLSPPVALLGRAAHRRE